MRILLIVAMCTAVCSNTASAEAVRSLTMLPGDSMPVEYPAGTTVKVSRKGVVDVFSISETSWQLTALRGGMVIVDAFDPSGLPQLPRLFIDVKAKSEVDRPAVTIGLPIWICKHRGISCPDDSGIIQGTTDDYRWFLRAKSWCGHSQQCAWHVSLSGPASADLISFLNDVLDGYQVRALNHGRIAMHAPCDGTTYEGHKDVIEAVLPRAIEEKVVAFSCTGDQNAYRITVRAKKSANSEGQTTGYESNVKHELSAPPMFSSVAAAATLKLEAVEAKSETVGEPTFIVSGNREFQTLIGGELPYMSQSESLGKTYQWKEYGLSIKGLLQGVSGTTAGVTHIRGAFEFFLKTVNDRSAGGLLSSSLKTNVVIPLTTWTLVGELDLSSEMDGRRSVPFLSSLPLIGPLFRTTTSARSKNKLQVWTHIEPLATHHQ